MAAPVIADEHGHFKDKRFKHGHVAGGKWSPEYRSWAGMISRCYQPINTSYDNYGGRGIKVCERRRSSFAAFLADMGPKPSPKFSLDRINSDADYTPDNCRWATWSEQMRNRRPLKRDALGRVLAKGRPEGSELGRILRGAENGFAKLTEQKVAEIKRRLSEGEKGASLAREFGVKKATVYDIAAGRTWGHIPGETRR
jgi:hypothetical protein